MTQSKQKKTSLDKALHLVQELLPEDQEKLLQILLQKKVDSTGMLSGQEFKEWRIDLDAIEAANPKIKPFKSDDWKLDFWDDDEHNAFLEWRKQEREDFYAFIEWQKQQREKR